MHPEYKKNRADADRGCDLQALESAGVKRFTNPSLPPHGVAAGASG